MRIMRIYNIVPNSIVNIIKKGFYAFVTAIIELSIITLCINIHVFVRNWVSGDLGRKNI